MWQKIFLVKAHASVYTHRERSYNLDVASHESK